LVGLLAGPASAGASSITIKPDSDLSKSQTVEVSAVGLMAGRPKIQLQECDLTLMDTLLSSGKGDEACDLSNAVNAVPSAKGKVKQSRIKIVREWTNDSALASESTCGSSKTDGDQCGIIVYYLGSLANNDDPLSGSIYFR
jgi:hypothetical protein